MSKCELFFLPLKIDKDQITHCRMFQGCRWSQDDVYNKVTHEESRGGCLISEVSPFIYNESKVLPWTKLIQYDITGIRG